MKKFYIAFLLLFPVVTSAAPKLAENKTVQATVIEATSHLKQELSRELRQSTGLDEFVIKVELLIDEKKLQKSLGVNEQDWNKLQDLSLPGLFVEGKEAYSDSPLRQSKKEDILMSLRGIKIDLVYYQPNYTSEFLIGALKKIVLFNVSGLAEAQVEIAPLLEEAPFRQGDTSTPMRVSLIPDAGAPLSVNVIPTEFQSFWNENHKLIIVSAALVVLVVGFLMTTSFKGSVRNLTEVIKTKTFSMAGGSPRGEVPTARKELTDQNLSSGPTDTFESYVQATEHLTQMVRKEPKVFNEVIILKLMAEDFTALTILLDVLEKEKRESFLANIDTSKRERFKQFIVGNGTNVLRDETLLKQEAVKMIKLVKIAALSPDELYQIVISDLVSTMETAELAALLKLVTETEKSYLCDQLSSHQLAFLVQTDSLDPKSLEYDSGPLGKEELIDLLIKASSTRGLKKGQVRKDKLESVYAQVETEKAEVLADAMGIAPELRFEFLFTSFKGSAVKYLESMDFDGLSLLYPLLTVGMRKDLVKALPELLAERLQLARKKINSESLGLKGEFYFYLRSLSTETESGDSELKLTA